MKEEVMYCETCDRLFDKRDIIYEEEIAVGYIHRKCPCCGAEDELMEADECYICGEAIKPDRYICPNCDDQIRLGMNDLMETLGCKPDVFADVIDWYLLKEEEQSVRGKETGELQRAED